MILRVVFVILRIILSHSSAANLTTLKAVVGKLFELNESLITMSGHRSNIPNWLCVSHVKYQGIPLKQDITNYRVNDKLSISVYPEPKYNAIKSECIQRWPTVMVIIMDNRISQLSGCDRVKLWSSLKKYLPTPDPRLTFEEDIPSLLKSLSVLSQWSRKIYKSPSFFQSAIVYQIGCGSIPESVINKFKYFEKEDNVNRLSKVLPLAIQGWLIADQINPATLKKRRHRRNSYLKLTEYSSIFYQQEKQRKEDWKEAQIVVEGSGQFDENWAVSIPDFPGPKSTVNKTKNKTTIPVRKSEKSQPIIRKSLTNFTVLIGSRKYFQIPPQTFFDAEDGYNQQLKIKVYIRSRDSQIDKRINFNSSQWIYFLEKQQAIGLQPQKTDVGSYYITVCAYDSDKNRICDGVRLFIKKPKTINRKSHISAPPGVVWKYPIQTNWLDDVKHSNNDSVIIKVQSSSLIEWQGNISRISLVTEAYTSKEHKIKMIAESQKTGQNLIWEIIVTSLGLNSYVDATSPEIIVKLSSFHTSQIPFELINLIKEKLIGSISRYWTILKSSSREIFLYKIVKGKESFLKDPKDSTAILSFVYSPLQSNSVNCSEVSFPSELLESMKYDLRKTSNNWNIELVDTVEIPGKCANREVVNKINYQTTSKPNFISSNQRMDAIPDLINKSINLEVRNGLTFKKIILLPFQIGYSEVIMMELVDTNNLVIDESPWVALLISPYAIYGLPLPENVRTQPYKFKLKVTLRSGSVQEVIVNIVVVKFELPIDHKFALIISISEKDTLEFDRARQQINGNPLKTMNQLLVSQTLSYRWQVVETIGRYLHADQCLLDCGTNIYIHSFSEPKSWQVNMSWSMLFDSPDSPDYSTAACSQDKLKRLIRLLIKSDQFTESIISMFLSSIYTFEAYPHQNLVQSLQKKYLGTPTWLTVDPLGSCSREINSSESVFWSNISLNQGSIFVVLLDKKLRSNKPKTIYQSKILFANGTVCDLEWLKLSRDGRTIYGLPLTSNMVKQSYFSLRILLESGEVKENLKYYLSVSIKPSRHSTARTHIVNVTMLPFSNYAKQIHELDSKIKIARALNAFLHPSCSLGNQTIYNGFKMFKLEPHKRKHFEFCEKAEDIILHSIRKRIHNKKVFVDIIWSQVSIWSTENDSDSDSICNANALKDLSRNLFQNQSTQEINQEFVSYFENSGIGLIQQTQLILFDKCLDVIKRGNLEIPYSPVPKDYLTKIGATSQASTKIIVGVLFFILIFISSICIILYFVKRGIPATFRQLTEKTNKSIALEDFNKSPINSPMSSFVKKPKNKPALDSFGPSLSNNSPKTPLLSQFSRDDTKSDRQNEQAFNEEEAIGSYTYAVRHPKTPEPEIASNNSVGISKQPATSNVIRNPAMMMGSRLNPYRNIPPPII